MSQTLAELREQRLQKLYADCQQQVISQIIGPFGLSTAMFDDKTGGNVTTQHNAEKDIFAKESESYKRADYDYSSAKKEKMKESVHNGNMNSQEFIDTYTGKAEPTKRVNKNGKLVMNAEVDHTISMKQAHREGGWMKDKTGRSEMSSEKDNLNYTTHINNRQKSSKPAEDALSAEKGFDESLTKPIIDKARVAIDDQLPSNKDRAIYHGKELLQVGGQQAVQMGLRQALGVLLTELVNALFNEILTLIKHGVEFGKTLFEDIHERLGRIIESVAKKLPDAVSQMFQGGVSGFMSNLLTFLLNNFLSTAKRFVTAIREGLLGLFKAFKMIFFPPENMTQQEAMQAGLKILTAVVISTVGILLQETIATFMATLPFLKPFADIITPILIGTMTGLLSAFLAYQIDCMFDRFFNNERLLDELIADAKRRDEFANELVKLSDSSLQNVNNYSESITIYQSIGNSFGAAGLAANATLYSLEATVTETREQVAKSIEMIGFINSSQLEIEGFLKEVKYGN